MSILDRRLLIPLLSEYPLQYKIETITPVQGGAIIISTKTHSNIPSVTDIASVEVDILNQYYKGPENNLFTDEVLQVIENLYIEKRNDGTAACIPVLNINTAHKGIFISIESFKHLEYTLEMFTADAQQLWPEKNLELGLTIEELKTFMREVQ